MSTFFYHRFLILALLFPLRCVAQSPCLTQIGNDSITLSQQQTTRQHIQQWITDQSALRQRSVISIPIVLHIVWHEAEENISLEQIESQIKVLNDAFRARLDNLPTVPAIFQPLIADTEIEFCLAQRDTENKPTTGIVRTNIFEPAIVNDRSALFTASPLWNPAEYLNIYVVALEPNVDGDAIFPAAATLTNDAIRVNYRSFGTIGTATVNPARSGGKSLVHEIGHYLGLQHIWGPEEGCIFDDFVGNDDTPLQARSYLQQCPNGIQISCETPDMYMNFMDYTDDDCLAMFTPDQKMWMLGVLNTVRSSLLRSRGCEEVVDNTFVTEPVSTRVWYDSENQLVTIYFANNQKNTQIYLYDISGRIIATTNFVNRKRINWRLNLPQSGIYYLHLRSVDEARTLPLFFSDGL